MTASEARGIATRVEIEKYSKELDRAYHEIENAAKKGSYYAYLNFCIMNKTKEKLQTDGFTVKVDSSQREGESTVIKW